MKRMALIVQLVLVGLSPSLAHAQVRIVPGVRVTVAPPAPRHELAPPAPSPRHQWIAGYWGWRGGAHVWLAGHWALPPAPGYLWEPARWEEVGGSLVFFDGHWRPTDGPDPSQAYQPPPDDLQTPENHFERGSRFSITIEVVGT